MSPRLHLSIHSRRSNRHCPIKLFPWHRTPRHILRSSPFSLCPIYRSSIRHYSRLCSLVPIIFGLHPRRHLSKSPLRHHICRSKHNILPSTFSRPFRNTSTIFWLPRCLHHMKYSILYGVIHLINSRTCNNFHNLRGIRLQTRSRIGILLFNKSGVTSWLPPTISHIRRALLC